MCISGSDRPMKPILCAGGDVEVCPAGCTSFYDGCNTCKCDGVGKLGACTKKFCVTKNKPRCLSSESNNDTKMCPKNCALWFDGCNNCRCMEEGKGACTKKAC